MKGIILAAGAGTRLAHYGSQQHKALLPVGGRAIIDYTLDAFCQVGVTDLAIVIGHRGDALRDWLGDGSQQGLRIDYITNRDYLRGNALSLYAARAYAGDEPFLLSMADHMVSPDLLLPMLDIHEHGSALALDMTSSPRQVEEATRVTIDDDGFVTQVGKDLSDWDGIDAGVFRLGSTIFDALEEIVCQDRTEYQLSEAVNRMIDLGQPLEACDITGSFWQDIDTWDDLMLVRESLEG